MMRADGEILHMDEESRFFLAPPDFPVDNLNDVKTVLQLDGGAGNYYQHFLSLYICKITPYIGFQADGHWFGHESGRIDNNFRYEYYIIIVGHVCHAFSSPIG